MTTRLVSGILLMIIGGFGLMMAFFGMVAEFFALVPFGLLGLLPLVVGIVLIATAGARSRPGPVRHRGGARVGGGYGGDYPVHGGGWYADNDPRGYDDSGRGSSGGYDSGPSSDSGWSGGDGGGSSGGGWSGGDSGGSSGGDSGGGF